MMHTWNDGTYLAHHGIKGQKWGVRRYQNEDGSLTDAGRKRYGYGASGNYKNRVGVAKASYKKNLEESARRHSSPDGSMTLKQIKDFDKEATALGLKLSADIKEAKKEYLQSDEFKSKMKKAAIVGVAIAGTALAAYGTYKLSQSMKDKAFNKSYKAGMEAVEELVSGANAYLKIPDNVGGRDYDVFRSRYMDVLNDDVRRTAAYNSKNLVKSIQTINGSRQFSRAELERMGISTVPTGSSDSLTEFMLRSYRKSRQ